MGEKIAGLLLAAGDSSRLQIPKQLLKINHQYLINYMIQIIHKGGIEDVYVVLGAFGKQIQAVIDDTQVNISFNSRWRKGIHTSIISGIQAIQPQYPAVIIFVVDQPLLNPNLIQEEIEIYERERPTIIAPSVDGQQLNPVLFSCKTFHHLLKLKRGQAGKDLLSRYPVRWINWEDATLSMDIDTMADYAQILAQLSSSGGEEK